LVAAIAGSDARRAMKNAGRAALARPPVAASANPLDP